MPDKPSPAKRKRLLYGAAALIVLLVISVAGFYLFGNQARDPAYAICTSYKYRLITSGMNKSEVTSIFGEPNNTNIKQPSDRNFMAQGEKSSQISEAWIYNQPGHATAAEIYFDSNGHVNGKGCGQG